MIPKAQDSKKLLEIVKATGLYDKFIIQIEKDLQLTGLLVSISKEISPNDVIDIVFREVNKLLQYNFDTYMQLLYRVDISEETMYSKGLQSTEEIAQKATFAILKREWQKVYFKNKYEQKE